MYKLSSLIKGIRLRFSNAGRDSAQDERSGLNNKELDLWLGLWSLTPSYSLDLEPLGPYNSEPLKQHLAGVFQSR